MGTVSIKQKVFVTDETKQKIRQAHDIFNWNVRKFEEFLLLSRGKDYYYRDADGNEIYVSKEEAEEKRRAYLEARGVRDVSAVSNAISGLDRAIQTKGDANMASGALIKLYNKNSEAGLGSIDKIVEPEPAWVERWRKEGLTDEVFSEASDWALGDGAGVVDMLTKRAKGRASAFRMAYEAHKREWPEKFIHDQEKYRKDFESGTAGILYVLDRMGCLPLIDCPSELLEVYSCWPRLYLKTAIENFLSYIAWDDKTREAYEEALREYDEAKAEAENSWSEELCSVEKFLSENYAEAKDRSVYLNKRMCRGLKDIQKAWKDCRTTTQRISALNELQSDKKTQKKLGDINFYRWAAEDENIRVLKEDCLDALLRYYTALRKKELKKKCASYTVADPVASIRNLYYRNNDKPGSGLRAYSLSVGNKGEVSVCLPLLLEHNGVYYEEIVNLPIVRSGQMRDLERLSGSEVTYTNSKKIASGSGSTIRERFYGDLGGIDLCVDAREGGATGDIYINFTITLKEENDRFAANAMSGLALAFDGKENAKYDPLLAGKDARIIAVSLSTDVFAGCAVGLASFGSTMADIPTLRLERMFQLALPGEKENVGVKEREARSAAYSELRELKSLIYLTRLLKRIYKTEEPDERKKLLEESTKYYKNAERRKIFISCLEAPNIFEENVILERKYEEKIEELDRAIKTMWTGECITARYRRCSPELSLWAISYLEEVRKSLISFAALSHRIDEENKTMGRSYGVTASRLLEHINRLKKDRIRKSADMLVMSALGYRYDADRKCWVKKYEPAQIIAFEDMSRYSFNIERPAWENSMLMRWSHREIVAETMRQAAPHGIAVYDGVDPPYAMRYNCMTNAPGIRCRRLGRNDFIGGELKDSVREKLPAAYNDCIDRIKPNCLVPDESGNLLASITEDGSLYLIDVYRNSACNILRRYAERHTHLFRLNTVCKEGGLCLKSGDTGEKSIGKREKGKWIYHYGTDNVMLAGTEKPGVYCITEKKGSVMTPKPDDEEMVYNVFRDPSGIVLPDDEWRSYKDFWSLVEDATVNKMKLSVIGC